MRTILFLVAVAVSSACGSLVETALPDASTGGGGLFCAADDPCVCTPCTSSAECAAGLSCLTARRKGMNCPDLRTVCTTGE
ncbi:MAG: hypothetical protein AB1730_18985 [Myxococcota bacterium]|jgi:Cys-rich repeat protein